MKIVNTKHKSKTGNIFKLCFFNLLSMKITTYQHYYFQKYYRNSKICHTKVTIMITQINVALKKNVKCVYINASDLLQYCIRHTKSLHSVRSFWQLMSRGFSKWLASTDWWRKVSLKIVLIILIKWFHLLYFKVRN